MRVLFFGDMAATGFGTVTVDLGRELLKLGADVRFVSQNELLGDIPEPFASRTVDTRYLLTQMQQAAQSDDKARITGLAAFVPSLLSGEETGDVLLSNMEPWGDWKPDAVLMLGDFAQVRYTVSPHAEAFRKVPAWHYCPVEGVDLPPAWKLLWDDVKPVAMSRFGQTQIAAVMGYVPPLAYHGVNTDDFWPVSSERPITIVEQGQLKVMRSKEDCKRYFGADPRERWVLRTDSHWPRKNQNALLRIMGQALPRHERAWLILHCSAIGPGGNLGDTISKLPKAAQERIRVTNTKVSRKVLNILYNAADIYASTSAEGFGLTIAEALSCAVPVVALDYSAVPEVVGPAGYLVPVGALTDNEYDHFWARPDEAAFAEKVDFLLSHPGRARALGAAGPAHVRSNFTWAEAGRQFLAIMGGIDSQQAGESKESALVDVHTAE